MNPTDTTPRRSWGEAARAFLHPRVLTIFWYGISAGIPFFLIFGTLSVWLREAGIERSTLTFFSWAALGYSFKYVWSPLVDRLPIPGLTQRMGRRRSWLLVSQLAVMGAILAMAFSDPQANLLGLALASVALGFSAATQDIVIDAYRIESAGKELQAMMSSAYVAGYRVGMLLSGAGALKLASYFGDDGVYNHSAWTLSYAVMAACMLVGVATTLTIEEPPERERDDTNFQDTGDYLRFVLLFVLAVGAFIFGFVLSRGPAASLKASLVEHQGLMENWAGFFVETGRLGLSIALAALVGTALIGVRLVSRNMVRDTYVAPITNFIQRYGRSGFILILLIGTYRVSDIVLGVMSNVFYIDQGFTKDEIANIAKTFGLFMLLLGGFLGGVLSVRYGVLRILFLGAVLSSGTNVLFALLAGAGHNVWMLTLVIAADNLAQGLATATFVAYLSSLTSIRFTATQYALFSSIMTLFPKLLAGYSGGLVDTFGYANFFIGTALIGIPVLGLIVLASRIEEKPLDD